MIWLDEGAPASPGRHAMLTVALAGSEAETFFGPGQCFTIWADGLAGSTVQAIGRVGYGVIACRMSPARARIIRHASSRRTGSRPVADSSRKTTAGYPTRLAARSRRRHIPPE